MRHTRIIPWPNPNDAVNLLRDESNNIRTVTVQQCSGQALKAVDDQLEPFGLEIVQFDHPSGNYVWKIEARLNQSRVRTAIESRKSST